MNAVAEKPVKKPAPAYQMPRPSPGMFVRWYNAGNPADTWRGIVRKVYVDTIEIHVLGWALGPKKVCRHVTDPGVTGEAKPDYVRETGLWDFTEEHYDNLSWRQAVCERLADIERQLAAKENKAK